MSDTLSITFKCFVGVVFTTDNFTFRNHYRSFFFLFCRTFFVASFFFFFFDCLFTLLPIWISPFSHPQSRLLSSFTYLFLFYLFHVLHLFLIFPFFFFFFICWSSVCTTFLLLISICLTLTSFKWIYRCLSFSYVSPFFTFFLSVLRFYFFTFFRLILSFIFYYFHLSFLWYLLFLFIFSNNFSLIFISYFHSFSTTELFPGSFLSSKEPLSFIFPIPSVVAFLSRQGMVFSLSL